MGSRLNEAAGWRGRFFLDPGWMLYVGPVGATSPHAHHAIQIVIGVKTRLSLMIDGDRAQVDSVVIPADTPHAFEAPAAHAVMLYVGPETRDGRRLSTLVHGGAPSTWAAAAAPLRDAEMDEPRTIDDARRYCRRVIELLVGSVETVRPWPPAVRRLVALLPGRLSDDVKLPALAAEVGVSASRLSHLVTEHLGIPFRPYLRWLRLLRAAAAIARGRSITEAAFEAGFADGPHLTRSFREMFGVTPSDVAAHATWHLDATLAGVP